MSTVPAETYHTVDRHDIAWLREQLNHAFQVARGPVERRNLPRHLITSHRMGMSAVDCLARIDTDFRPIHDEGRHAMLRVQGALGNLAIAMVRELESYRAHHYMLELAKAEGAKKCN